MCRRTRLLVAVFVSLVVAPLARADEVAAYLQHHQLKQLLAVYLQDQMSGLTGAQRDEHLGRLIGIYAELLESTDDPEAIADLRRQSRQVLGSVSADVGAQLRLALLRGSYRAAERIAENHRLRQSSDEEVQRARETLSEIIPKLHQLRGVIEDRFQATERRMIRSAGGEAEALSLRAEKAQRLLATCTFLNAWAQYYQSWLHDRPDNARVAEPLFAQMLDAESARPQPREVSVDLRSVEAVARSILGMALCKSLTSSSATAIKWIELLEHPLAYSALREQVPAWKIAIHLEHGEYRAALAILTAITDAGQIPPVAWVRLAAVHALEANPGTRDAAGELARLALTLLAAQGELQQVLDLSERYGIDALGNAGFAFRYVKGVQHYQRARREHGSDRPSFEVALIERYQHGVDEFEAALAEHDADRYPRAAASCQWLAGWCRYFQGRFLAARDSFEQAAQRLGPAEAAEAMWMAVVCLDRVASRSSNNALKKNLSELIDRTLAAYPGSRHAAKLMLRRAIVSGEISPEVVEDLLLIPSESEVYEAAQRRAAHVLYQLFRRDSGERQLAYGIEYLAVALPLVGDAENRLDGTDPDAVRLYVARSRRVLDVALTEGIGRVAAAGSILEDLRELGGREGVDLSDHQDEIDFRRIQHLLYTADVDAAAAVADALWLGDRQSLWSRLACRALFDHGLGAGGDSDDGPIVQTAELQLVVRYGRRLIKELAEGSTSQPAAGVLGYSKSVAEALMLLWQRDGDPGKAQAAVELYESVLQARPTDAKSLRATAFLSEAVGRPARAMECWRKLAAGYSVGAPNWYEARFHLITLLAELDPPRARAVIRQHKKLNPSWGPEPWASRFEALQRRIGPAEEAGVSHPAEGDHER